MARRTDDPLPVFMVGGITRLNVADLEAWLGRQRDRVLLARNVQAEPTSGAAQPAGDDEPRAEAERLRDENAYLRDENARLRAELVLAKEDHW